MDSGHYYSFENKTGSMNTEWFCIQYIEGISNIENWDGFKNNCDDPNNWDPILSVSPTIWFDNAFNE